MKYISIISAILAMSAFSVSAQTMQAQGGFQGPNASNLDTTVKQVMASGFFSDDTPVVLTGYIKERLGKDKYRFVDNTGAIVVEIDHDKWYGVKATAETKVTLYGEIDKDFNSVSVDVDRVVLAK